LPGVSALDALLADLRLDPVVHGLQMYEATDVLLRRRPLQSDVPAVLWQIGPIETCLHSQAVSLPGRFARLVAHLRHFYPARREAGCFPPHPVARWRAGGAEPVRRGWPPAGRRPGGDRSGPADGRRANRPPAVGPRPRTGLPREHGRGPGAGPEPPRLTAHGV